MLLAPTLFLCSVVSVHDGDGPIHCEQGQRIRLAGIAAREMDGTCNANQPCPAASAIDARDTLRRLVTGRTLRCRQVGMSYRRVVAWCALPSGADVSCQMVRSGTVLLWASYDRGNRLGGCER